MTPELLNTLVYYTFRVSLLKDTIEKRFNGPGATMDSKDNVPPSIRIKLQELLKADTDLYNELLKEPLYREYLRSMGLRI